MSSTKLHLSVESTQDFFFADCCLVGIACRLPDYRMCWTINQYLDMSFYRDRQLDLCMQKGQEEHFFSIYVYDLPMHGGQYFVYSLRSENKHLIPELQNLDFLWLFQSSQSELEARFYLPFIRKIPEVQLAQIYAPESLKSRANLIL